jgi:hypothetical protein
MSTVSPARLQLILGKYVPYKLYSGIPRFLTTIDMPSVLNFLYAIPLDHVGHAAFYNMPVSKNEI